MGKWIVLELAAALSWLDLLLLDVLVKLSEGLQTLGDLLGRVLLALKYYHLFVCYCAGDVGRRHFRQFDLHGLLLGRGRLL